MVHLRLPSKGKRDILTCRGECEFNVVGVNVNLISEVVCYVVLV